MDNSHKLKEVIFYTRGPKKPNISAVFEDGSRYRFVAGEMESELASLNITPDTLRKIGTSAYRKALSFVPNDDKWLIEDSTEYFKPADQKHRPLNDPEPITEQKQSDLDAVQNLLFEFQSATEDDQP